VVGVGKWEEIAVAEGTVEELIDATDDEINHGKAGI
jgi:hypothetical protein